ncbi:hypothetical protein DM01DRAFT_1408946 [Hesseltinella vesiculosa]|uniref:Uncharacterized protein n=1 Tax=Hesseltinella vesiculosa TaxID=101127 RepID=A0A1X2GD11_9FUNG|nr:hypothetical protein DM01DRAFT_1408946 [Hesseltinella vesiculosa]
MLIRSVAMANDLLETRIHQAILPTFSNAGHNSTSFTTVHIIAATIGIVGALALISWCAVSYVRRRQRQNELQQQTLSSACTCQATIDATLSSSSTNTQSTLPAIHTKTSAAPPPYSFAVDFCSGFHPPSPHHSDAPPSSYPQPPLPCYQYEK